MNTGNWQIKILTLFMVAFALCLTVACGDAGTDYAGPERITPSAPCGDADAPLVPSVEFQQFSGIEHWTDGSINTRVWNRAAQARGNRLGPEMDRVQAVIDKYRDRIRRLPGVNGFGVSELQTENTLPTDKLGIRIIVTEHIDQSTLPPEDRIQDCLEGVPVHFEIGGPFEND